MTDIPHKIMSSSIKSTLNEAGFWHISLPSPSHHSIITIPGFHRVTEHPPSQYLQFASLFPLPPAPPSHVLQLPTKGEAGQNISGAEGHGCSLARAHTNEQVIVALPFRASSQEGSNSIPLVTCFSQKLKKMTRFEVSGLTNWTKTGQQVQQLLGGVRGWNPHHRNLISSEKWSQGVIL